PRFSKIETPLSVSFLQGALKIAQPIAAVVAPATSAGSLTSLATNMLGSGLYDFDSVNYVVFGSYKSPSFIKGGGGRFAVNVKQGTMQQVPDDVTFMVAVPKPTAANGYKQPPYPCVVFGHGIYRCRIDGLGVATQMARMGYATIGIDVFGHGPDDNLSHLPALAASYGAQSTTNDLAIRAGLEGLAALTGSFVNPLDPLDVMAKNVFSQSIFAPLVT